MLVVSPNKQKTPCGVSTVTLRLVFANIVGITCVTYLLTYYSLYLLTYLLTYLSIYLLTYLLTYLFTYLLIYLLAYVAYVTYIAFDTWCSGISPLLIGTAVQKMAGTVDLGL